MEPKNYLYYVILDSDQKIRGNIIGTQHDIDCRDKGLNTAITDAIKRSSRAILEMPPGSKLLNSSNPHYIPNPEWVIKNAVEEIKLHPGNSEVIANIKKKVKLLLKDIKDQTVLENYNKVLLALGQIQSSQDKLTFVQAILANMSEFNEVSLEENINEIVKANKKCEIAPLEDIDLAAELETAKLKTTNKTEPPVDENTKILREKNKREIYKAWVRGDAKELKKLLKDCFELNPEPSEIEEVHKSRDANMAKRIVEFVLQVKKEDTECTIVLGDAHLLYSKRKNVIEYLNERFETDLSGWSIMQVKSD
jgi:TraB/PrgY/gumN family